MKKYTHLKINIERRFESFKRIFDKNNRGQTEQSSANTYEKKTVNFILYFDTLRLHCMTSRVYLS